MDVRIYQENAKFNEKRNVSILNPFSKKFTIKHKGVDYSIDAQEEKEFNYYVAERFVKKMVDRIVGNKNRIVSDNERKEMENRIRLYEQDTTT